MGKPVPQKKKRGPSIHSRAARRATSPVNTDRALNDVTPPRENNTVQPSVLAARQGAGVNKKTKRKAVASARARRKHEKDVDMAEAVSERTSLKAERSARHAKAIKGRRKTWEEVNMALGGGIKDVGPAGGKNAFAALGEEDDEEEMGDGGDEAPLRAVVPQMVYGGEAQEDEEIL